MEGLALEVGSVDTSSVRVERVLGGLSGSVGSCGTFGGGIDCPSGSGCWVDCGLMIRLDVADDGRGV
jgi:hypothetical protein